ncbi:ORF6N domain-containing protein [Blautia argi]|uniref:ORF6N domain-containing protein n=1 Tax=Blautia argi TaxID=1912897 RepID=UPI002942B43A|nr:ORF6N domain-containing protein [Blautia argi]
MQLPETLEVKGMKVLTTKQVAEAYGTTPDVIGYNYRYNKERYKEGKHYIMLEKQALREYKITNVEIQRSLPKISKLYLWTEKGALLHAKSLNTDKAWETYDYLVDFYFRAKEEKRVEEKKEVVPTETTVKPFKALKAATERVVDIPENGKAQELISDMKKYITGMEALLDIYDMYLPEAEFKNIAEAINKMSNKINTTAHFLRFLKPKMVTKYL